MSGVIDSAGQQWEPCNHCGEYTRYQDLEIGPSPLWPDYDFVDLCPICYDKFKTGMLTTER